MGLRGLKLLGLMVVAVAFSASCGKPVKVYSGPDLPKDGISVIAPLIKSGSHLSSVNITRINGIRIPEQGNNKYQVKPGNQVLRVELFQEGPNRGAFTTSHSINTVSFDAQPGRSYKVVGDMFNGNGKVWVVDAESGKAVVEAE